MLTADAWVFLSVLLLLHWLVWLLYLVQRQASQYDWLVLQRRIALPAACMCPAPLLLAGLWVALTLEAVGLFLLWHHSDTAEADTEAEYLGASWVLAGVRLLLVLLWAPFHYGALALHVHGALALLGAFVHLTTALVMTWVSWEAALVYGLSVVFSGYYAYQALMLFRANQDHWRQQHAFAPQAFHQVAQDVQRLTEGLDTLRQEQQSLHEAFQRQQRALTQELRSAPVPVPAPVPVRVESRRTVPVTSSRRRTPLVRDETQFFQEALASSLFATSPGEDSD